jgi:primosomal protein N' (replication factor Y)
MTTVAAAMLGAEPGTRLVSVAVMSPAPGPYLYRVPDEITVLPEMGARVLVPLGGQPQVEGLILEVFAGKAADTVLLTSGLRPEALRNLGMMLSGPKLPADLLGMARFIADYYLAPHGEALRLLLPPSEHAQLVERVRLTEAGLQLAKKVDSLLLPPEVADIDSMTIELLRVLGSRRSPLHFVSIERVLGADSLPSRPRPEYRARLHELRRQHLVEIHCDVRVGSREREPKPPSAEHAMPSAPTDLVLTDEQDAALTTLLGALANAEQATPRRSGYHGFLLHGVTGSGKTEVYLRLIAEARQLGQTALVLVPEIALTPQLSARFSSRFPGSVAVLHSALSPGERASAWRKILRGEVAIALGPRSAVFAPLPNLGVIIVDEEHDTSFKQHEGVHYHGRDVALWRAQQAGAVAVLGSATPSLEALELSRRGKLTRLVLSRRATGIALPRVEIIDLKQHVKAVESALLTAPLLTALQTTLDAGEQAILLLNRRGYAPFLLCQSCGHRIECPSCSVTLTLHKSRHCLLCHYCDHREPVPDCCPLCQQKSILPLGIGTEKLHEQLALRFPEARIERLDRDTSGSLTRVLSAMHRHEIDVLIGTQMLAKGHDFPGVTLVGVVLADTGMGLPDFRAGERTFQLLSQVAGRAGRASRAGRVLIQTYNPEHPAVHCAAQHDYQSFAEAELEARHVLSYPPSVRLGLLRIDGEDPYKVEQLAQELAAILKERGGDGGRWDVAARAGRSTAVAAQGS